MTNLEAADLLDNLIGMVSDNHDSDYDEALSKGRDILKSEPCEDCISRQAIVGYLCTHCPDDAECFGDCEDIKNIKALPSVTPQPKTGRWIKIEPYPMMEHEYKCSECYNGTDDPFEKYCSECGAKMTESEGRE